jgi:transcriptional regulator GlxA family with amidase domain
MTTDAAVLVYDGFDELDAVGPFEVLANAARAGADLSVRLVAPGGGPATASHGLRVEPDGVLPGLPPDADDGGGDGAGADAVDAGEAPDLLVVPGGGWSDADGPGARREAERGRVPAAVAALHAAGTTVAAVCTGGMIAARAGVVEGRPAVTHRSALEDLRAAGATVVDARVVDDGDLVTAGGVTAGLDMAVHLVEREFGAEVAAAVTTEMEYEPRGTVHRG